MYYLMIIDCDKYLNYTNIHKIILHILIMQLRRV